MSLAHLRVVLIESVRFGEPVLLLKLDLRKAYDTVLLHALVRQGRPSNLAHAILQLHKGRRARMKTNLACDDAAELEAQVGDPTDYQPQESNACSAVLGCGPTDGMRCSAIHGIGLKPRKIGSCQSRGTPCLE